MKKNIIIVDDEKIIRETLGDFFEDSGWNVSTFSSGEEALLFLEKNSVEYAIVDGRLSGMKGTEFIRKACRLKSGIKYVIYTGASDITIEDDLRKSGVTEKNIVMKPAMGFSVLLNALEMTNEDEKEGE